MRQCIFCNFSQIKNKVFAETKSFWAIYNLYPVLPGHVLVIPKKHKQFLKELTDDERCELMKFASKVEDAVETLFEAEGLDWVIQDGSVAGQTIPHLHLHIIPRKSRDILQGKSWRVELNKHNKLLVDVDKRRQLMVSDEEFSQIIPKLRKFFN